MLDEIYCSYFGTVRRNCRQILVLAQFVRFLLNENLTLAQEQGMIK